MGIKSAIGGRMASYRDDVWTATTPEMTWFSASCAIAVQPKIANKMRVPTSTVEQIVENLAKLESSAKNHGAIVVTVAEQAMGEERLLEALKIRNWRMVTRFANPFHAPYGRMVSMWVKSLTEEVPL